MFSAISDSWKSLEYVVTPPIWSSTVILISTGATCGVSLNQKPSISPKFMSVQTFPLFLKKINLFSDIGLVLETYRMSILNWCDLPDEIIWLYRHPIFCCTTLKSRSTSWLAKKHTLKRIFKFPDEKDVGQSTNSHVPSYLLGLSLPVTASHAPLLKSK